MSYYIIIIMFIFINPFDIFEKLYKKHPDYPFTYFFTFSVSSASLVLSRLLVFSRLLWHLRVVVIKRSRKTYFNVMLELIELGEHGMSMAISIIIIIIIIALGYFKCLMLWTFS